MRISLLSDKVPLLNVNLSGNPTLALFDTGATFNVYTGTEKMFKEIYPDSVNTGKYKLIKGHGAKERLCPVYLLPVTVFGELEIHNMPVAISIDNDVELRFIMASYVLQKTPFKIDYNNKVMHVETGTGRIDCRYTLSDNNSDLIKSFVVFNIE